MRWTLIPLLIAAQFSLHFPAASQTHDELKAEVWAAELNFARSMEMRDLDLFESFVAADAIFFGEQDVLTGRLEVVDGWRPYFEGENAPFSWEPVQVEVLESGTLAHSSGPVRDAEGNQIATFNSIWRRDENGKWKVVFDKGCAASAELE